MSRDPEIRDSRNVPEGQVGIGEGSLKMVSIGKGSLFFLDIFIGEEDCWRQFTIVESLIHKLEQ